MTVDSADSVFLAVKKYFSILDLHGAEAHSVVKIVAGGLGAQLIELRFFGSPTLDSRYPAREGDLLGFIGRKGEIGRAKHFAAKGNRELVAHLIGIRVVKLNAETAVGVVA